jgi:hypothetical protein
MVIFVGFNKRMANIGKMGEGAAAKCITLINIFVWA